MYRTLLLLFLLDTAEFGCSFCSPFYVEAYCGVDVYSWKPVLYNRLETCILHIYAKDPTTLLIHKYPHYHNISGTTSLFQFAASIK